MEQLNVQNSLDYCWREWRKAKRIEDQHRMDALFLAMRVLDDMLHFDGLQDDTSELITRPGPLDAGLEILQAAGRARRR